MASILERVTAGVSKAFMAATGVGLVLMMVHVVADVAMKFVFNSPIIGTLETVSYYYMVCVVFLPLAAIELRHEHVHVDLFTQFLPGKLQCGIYIAANLLGVLYFGGLAYQTFLDAIVAFQTKETIMSNYIFYVWPSRWALPLGFSAIVLALIVNALKAFRAGHGFTAETPGDTGG